jgi:hypothetical protein
LTARLALNSFELGVHGTAALARLREFAHVTGSPAEQALAQLEGEPAMLDFTAHGPWVPPPDIRLTLSPAAGQPPVRSIQTHGTVMLKDANWKAGFLANPVKISAATLHMEDAALRWDPVDFSYGPVKGIATLQLPQACDDPDGCPPKVTLRFGALDASALQVALLGAHEKGTLLSTLLARITPSSSPGWPQLEGNVTADSVALGPFALTNVAATVKVLPTGADVGAFDAGLLGGTVHGAATLLIGDKPDYNIDAAITNVNPAQLGQLAGMKWSGGELNGKGKLEMMGYTDQDLGHSAKGTIHFDWQHGAVSGVGAPASLSRFDRLSGDAAIADGGIDMSAAIVQMGSRKLPAHARITFGMPAQVSFGPPDATAKGKAKPPLK